MWYCRIRYWLKGYPNCIPADQLSFSSSYGMCAKNVEVHAWIKYVKGGMEYVRLWWIRIRLRRRFRFTDRPFHFIDHPRGMLDIKNNAAMRTWKIIYERGRWDVRWRIWIRIWRRLRFAGCIVYPVGYYRGSLVISEVIPSAGIGGVFKRWSG